MFKSLKLNAKLVILFLIVGLIPIIILWFLTDQKSSKTLSQQGFNQLISIRETKKAEIENYFETIRGQVSTMAGNGMVVEAMEEFNRSFFAIGKELNASGSDIKKFKQSVSGYYSGDFLGEFKNKTGETINTDSLIPTHNSSIILQNLYISSNPNQLGSKDNLVAANDGSSYSRAHAKYHPVIRDFLSKFGYYDIFLVEPKTGHIVYSVFKELDYATSLKTGPYNDTNFARVFNDALSKKKGEAKLEDFAPYAPSYNAAASFISSPIYDGAKLIGVLIFQMPIDKINSVMTSGERWKDVGLGLTGETYIVGADFKIRNDSRFLIEDKEKYLTALRDAGMDKKAIEQIDRTETSILLQDVKSTGAKEALAGKTDSRIIKDYRGVPVLSAYTQLHIEDVNWAILAEIDEAEAFKPISELRKTSVTVVIIMAVIVFIIGLVVARSIARPISAMAGAAEQISQGDLDVTVQSDSQDEIGIMAKAFGEMVDYLKDIAGSADAIERGDLSVEVTPKGEKDVLGNAFKNMTEYLQGVAGTADSIEQGDLSVEVTLKSEKDVLGNAFKNMTIYLKDMAETANSIEQGDLNVEVTPKSERDVLGNAFKNMTEYLQGMAGTADSIEQGDLSVEVTPKSERDVLGNSFKNMTAYLTGMADTANSIKRGDLNVDVQPKSELDVLGNAFKNMTTYLKDMAHTAEAIAKGDLRKDVVPNSERDVLGNSFKNMIEGLRDIIGQVRNGAEQIATASAEVAATSEESSRNNESASAVVEQITSGVHEMSANTQNVANSIEELVISVQSIAENSKKLVDISTNSAEVVNTGKEAVDHSTAGVTNITEVINASAWTMKMLGEKTDNIGNIVEVIDDIAEQTNLLALNAAIEAARAGEHGMGFAVVADEVRKLAERSAKSTKEISELIYDIQKETAGAVKDVEKNVKVVDGALELSKEVVKALQEIETSVTEVTKYSTEIGSATAQQAGACEEISTAVGQLNQVTQEISSTGTTYGSERGMEKLREMVQQNAASASQLAASSEEMSRQAESLNKAAAKFILSNDMAQDKAHNLLEAME